MPPLFGSRTRYGSIRSTSFTVAPGSDVEHDPCAPEIVGPSHGEPVIRRALDEHARRMATGIEWLARDGAGQVQPAGGLPDPDLRVADQHVLYLEAIQQLVEPIDEQVFDRRGLDG